MELITYVNPIALSDLNNDEHLNFQKSEYGVITSEVVPEVQSALPLYAQAIDEEDAAIARLKREDKTEEVEAADLERDSAMSGAWYQMKSFEFDPDPQKVRAAKHLLNIYGTFSKSIHSNYSKKSEGIDNLLQQMCGTTSGNLSGTGGMGGTTGTGGGMGGGMTGGGTSTLPYTADVTLLGMEPWLDRVKQTNDAFKAIYAAREVDRTQVELMKEVRETRRKTDFIFRNIINLIHYLVMVNGLEQYEPLIAHLNVLINERNDTLARRKALAKRKKDNAAEEDDDNTNTTPENNDENANGENGGENNGEENTNTDNGGFGDENTPSANA